MHIEPFQSPVQQARGRTPRAPRPAAPRAKLRRPTRGARAPDDDESDEASRGLRVEHRARPAAPHRARQPGERNQNE